MIEFQKLHIENFQSIKEVKLNLNTRKVYCVVGPNGSGKSSLFEALIWILYGKARSSNFIRFGSNYCKGLVELNLNGRQITITRYKNHPVYNSSVKITIDGKDLVLHTIREANRKIEELIGSPELFQSCVILTQGLPYDFTSLTPTTRKVIFEELIGIAYWDKWKEKLQKKLKELQTELNRILLEMQNLEKKQSNLQGKLEELENQTGLSSVKEELQETEKAKQILENELSNLPDINLKSIQDKLNRVIKKLSLLEKEYKDKISILNSGICPTCKQPYPENLINQVKERLKVIKEGIIQLKNLKKQLESQREIALKKQNLLAKYEILTKRIKALQNALTESQTNIKEKIENITKELELIQSELETLQNKQNELESDIEFLNYVIDLLKPSSRFRTNLLNRYVEALNTILTEFPIEFEIRFKLGKGLDLEIKKGGRILDLKSLSGGERRKVSIVILLALQQLMERIGGIRTNLLVVDEIFDALDLENLQFAVELFAGFEGEKSVFIITHNEMLKEMINNVIEVRKNEEGVSEYSNLS